VDVPVWPSLVAEIVAVPGATAVTRPLELTVATPVLSLDHETDRPASGAPSCAIGVAASCWVPPTNRDAEPGLTATDATGTSDTVIDEVPVCPSLVAEIVALPGKRAVTSPVELTIATRGLSLAQETALPASGAPS
jgi:hypothetical protein